MKGYIGFGATDPESGFRQGLSEGTYLEHEVRIAIDDIDRFIDEPSHDATMTGHISCDRFGGVCPLSPSQFNMLVDSADPDVKYMFYRMPFETRDGDRFTMLGHKTLRDDAGFDLWSDITTLQVRIYRGFVDGPDVTTPVLGPPPPRPEAPVATGIIHILALDAIKSALSFRTPAGVLHLPGAVKKFCAFYGRGLWDLFGRHHPAGQASSAGAPP